MRHTLGIALLLVAVSLAACGRADRSGLPPTPTLVNDSQAATVTPANLAPTAAATSVPPTAVPPSPTSFADGLSVRLATPDPSLNCPDHYPWFFENPARECAAIILNTWSVLQPFEHGLMLWTQEGGRTYVLIDDGSPFKPYQLVIDPLGLPLPSADPSLIPPAGLYQPEHGFALFWRNLVPGHAWVRERLGWATAPEMAYSAFWQCSTATGDAARCYINGPHDELIALTTGSAFYWTYLQTAVR